MIVLVTGLMRSGTSLVSRQLHLLGCPMGTKMRFPSAQVNGQEDWEDIEFTDFVLRAAIGTIDHGFVDRYNFFKQYIEKRSTVPVWGVKSPGALPFVEEFRNFGDVKVVLCTRDWNGTWESLKSQQVSRSVFNIQRLLRLSLDSVKPDLTIDIMESWNDPNSVKRKLQELLRS